MIRHISAAIAIAVAGLLGGCLSPGKPPTVANAQPVRIVSMNPCVDAVLMEIASPDQIAAVSHYSHDPRATSVPLTWALKYPAVSGAAEDVVAARPDLVIAGPHVSLQTIAALQRLGIPLMTVAVPETVGQSAAQITQIAARIGKMQAGVALNARIDRAIADARPTTPAVSALIWQGGGLVPGYGTLADELLTISGFRNVSSALGLKKWDILSVERLLLTPPDVLLAGQVRSDGNSADANRMLSHPVLRKVAAQIYVANYPSALLHCGGPVIIRSVSRLAAIRRSVEANR